MKIIKGNLVLKKDTVLEGDLRVEGNIVGKDGKWFSLKVDGNINCWDIDCWNINCGDINCMNIDCMNIDCMNINCWDIDCRNIIICDKIKLKSEDGKIKAKALITGRFGLEQRVWNE